VRQAKRGGIEEKGSGSTYKRWQVPEGASLRCSCRLCSSTVRKCAVRSIIFNTVRRSIRWDDKAHFDEARKAGQHERVAEYSVHLRRNHQGLRMVRHSITGQNDAVTWKLARTSWAEGRLKIYMTEGTTVRWGRDQRVRCIGDGKVNRKGLPGYSEKDRRQGCPHTTLITEMSGGNLTPLSYQLTQYTQDAAL
jgi:hypothetical protein